MHLILKHSVLHGENPSDWMTKAPRCQASRAPEKPHPAITTGSLFGPSSSRHFTDIITTCPRRCWGDMTTSSSACNSKRRLNSDIPRNSRCLLFRHAHNNATHNTFDSRTTNSISSILKFLISVSLPKNIASVPSRVPMHVKRNDFFQDHPRLQVSSKHRF